VRIGRLAVLDSNVTVVVVREKIKYFYESINFFELDSPQSTTNWYHNASTLVRPEGWEFTLFKKYCAI